MPRAIRRAKQSSVCSDRCSRRRSSSMTCSARIVSSGRSAWRSRVHPARPVLPSPSASIEEVCPPSVSLRPGNVDFVSGLGWYDDVVTYDDIDKLGDGGPLVYVDMSGNASVRFAVHSCAAELVASVAVGITHWDASTPAGSLPGPTPRDVLRSDPDHETDRGSGARPSSISVSARRGTSS